MTKIKGTVTIDGKEIEPGVPFRHGKHLWGVCEKCMSLVKLTGWARGYHICT